MLEALRLRVRSIRNHLTRHRDFWLLWATAVTFRLGAVLFFRPGGYIRDYSDLIYYQGRASWQDFGFLPYRDYWSEYPPLFPWLTVLIDRLTRLIPLWDDQRLWFAALFGLITVAAEGLTLACLYWLARRLHVEGALRVIWLYAGLFLPVYLMGGWFDALPVATIMAALTALIAGGPLSGPLLFGLFSGLGGALKLVPMALMAVVPLARARWRERVLAWSTAVIVLLSIYLIAFAQSATMTLASLRSLFDRSGWSTLYAWAQGYHRFGAVVGDVFDPAADMSLYAPRFPEWTVIAVFGALGIGLWLAVYRLERPPQRAKRVVTFAAAMYAFLLLAYPSWNPQYALYILPFIVLLLPGGRGLLYAVVLSATCLAEHPVLVNLIGPGGPLLLWIVVARTAVLLAIAAELTLLCLRPQSRWRGAAASLAALALIALLAGVPAFARSYAEGRFSATRVRPLALYLNTLAADEPLVTQQQTLARQLWPFLAHPERLMVAGGRPGRVEPLPRLVSGGSPFRYLEAPGDEGSPVMDYLEASGVCSRRWAIAEWHVWLCNGADEPPIARFAEGLILQGAAFARVARPGESFSLTLFWHAETSVQHDYTVFVHVVEGDERMAGQWDQVPAAGAAPTSTWEPGRLVVDEYRVPLRPDARGALRILTGLYDPGTGERLPVLYADKEAGDRRVEVGQVVTR